MNNVWPEPKDVVLKRANIHHSDITDEIELDCENNCPYCNDQVICIRPIGFYLQYYQGDMDILKRMKCLICSKEFWEIWGVFEDLDYLRLVREFEDLPKTGNIEDLALYYYTSIKPFFANIVRSQKGNYPIYKRLMPEVVDIFGMIELGPIESRFDILDLGIDICEDRQDDTFHYFTRSKS